MRRGRALWMLLALVLAVPVTTWAAPKGDKPKAAPKKKRSALWIRREKEFGTRLNEWVTARTTVYASTAKCPRCKGSGRTLADAKRRSWYVCDTCRGTGKGTDRRAYKKLRILSRAKYVFRPTKDLLGGTAHVSKIEVVRAELLTPLKAFADIRYTVDGIAEDAILRWRWGIVGLGESWEHQGWALYVKSPKDFPEIPPRPAPPEPTEPAALTDAQSKPLVDALAKSGVSARLTAVTGADGRFVFRVRPAVPKGEPFDAWIGKHGVTAYRALVGALPDWTDARFVWMGYWQNRYGERMWLPRLSASIARKEFDRAVWKNLKPAAQRALFRWEEHTHVRHHLVDPQPVDGE